MADRSEIVDDEGLRLWLNDKPKEWAQVIAARNALRVFPLVFSTAGIAQQGPALDLILSVWRANFLSWAACKYATRDMAVYASSAAVAIRASSNANTDASVSASATAAKAAAESARAKVTTLAIVAAKDSANAGVRAVEAAVRSTGTIPSYGTTFGTLWEAVKADCQYLLNGKGDLIEQPLWLNDVRGDSRYVANFPIWARKPFDEFADSDLTNSTSWNLIARWYRAVLPNGPNVGPRSPFGEKADIVIAMQPDEFWERNPAEVLDAIAGIVEPEDAATEPNSFYNLIVHGVDGSWEGSSGKMLRGRYLEHTKNDIKSMFDPIESAYRQILEMPTILAYENQHRRSARVVRLLDLHISNSRELEFWFETDERFAPISFDAMNRFGSKLGIVPAELHRTHWAIKEVNLFDVLPGIEGYEIEEALEGAVENLEPQAPAAFRFEWSDEKIVAQPPGTFSPDSETAQDLLDDARRKALSLAERLERSNAEMRVRDSLEGLIDVLTDRVPDLRPGLLRSRSRSIEADAMAYAAPSDERELFPDAVAALTDLSETLRDLQGCFPQLREIEAEIMALDIDPAKANEVKVHLDEIVDAVSDHENVVDQSAVYALHTMEGIASEDASPAVKQKRIAEYALVVRNFMSPLARFALDNALSKAVTEATRDVWTKARPKIVDGVADGMGSMARPATIIAIASLVHVAFGPAAAIAAAAAGFGKIDRLLKLVEKWLSKSGDDASDEEDIEEANT